MKLVVGLFLLVTVVGIRVLTAPGGSVESGVAELEQLQSTLAKAASSMEAANASSASATDGAEASAERRAGASLSQRRASDGEADSNRMVACQLGRWAAIHVGWRLRHARRSLDGYLDQPPP